MNSSMKTQTGICETQGDEIRQSIVNRLGLVEDRFRDTVRSVKHSFDLTYGVRHHPITTIGSSVFAGFLVGSVIFRNKKNDPTVALKRLSTSTNETNYSNDAIDSSSQTERQLPLIWKKFTREFEDEIRIAKAIAIGMSLSFLEKKSRNMSPILATYFKRIFEGINRKIGGESNYESV